MSFIKGNFRKYIFKSDKNYIVGLFKVRECSEDISGVKGKTITFTGYFDELNETDLYMLEGKILVHDRYGEQFATDSYEIVLPNGKDNIIDFLSSNIFSGIGVKKATKIVEVLGNDCLKIILDNPDNLYLVPSVKVKDRNLIYDKLKQHQESYEIVTTLTKYGFNTKDSLSIYNFYKSDTIKYVQDNPYTLINDIYDITFKKIDRIRNNFNIKEYDIRRVESGIIYVMEEVCNSLGNTYLEKEELISYVKRAIFINNNDLINDALNILIESGKITLLENKYMITKMYEAECYISDFIYNLTNKDLTSNIDFKTSINDLENFFNIIYNDDQKRAIESSINNDFLVITGGPGTGKTTIIKAICKLYQNINKLSDIDLNKYLVLLAPTGRASKRISENTLLPSYTIHRFLKWNKDDNSFMINENNKSSAKMVIIDEASMIDTYLLQNLFLGLKNNVKIVLIGDYNQLPSVGAGQVLKDIINSDIINVVKLEKLYRQKNGSNIISFAYDINHNNFDINLFNNDDDLTFIEANNNNMKEKLAEILLTYNDMPYDKFQVLAPIYKGDNGIDDLNYFMQNILNKKDNKKNEIFHDGVMYRDNDKVLQLVNSLEQNVFNGDIGKITYINDSPKEVKVDFDSNIVKYTPSILSNIKLAYTISIHKSQGSEFDIVVLPILNKYGMMLYKNLIYTAVTRAKKKLILVGEIEALKRGILNDRESKRKTNLEEFLKNKITTCKN